MVGLKKRSNKRAQYGYEALLNYRFSKVYYVFAFNPVTLKFSKRTLSGDRKIQSVLNIRPQSPARLEHG